MRESDVALARELLAKSETELAEPTDAETLDCIMACAVRAYEPGSVYLRALSERRLAARAGRTIDLMRWSRAVTRARAFVMADASARQSTGRDPRH
jgi:hypothetical protein